MKCERILIAPLDWGLGHTSRCVPLIRYLTAKGHQVTVACNNSQRIFINKTFGAIDTLHIDGYNVTYTKKKGGFFFSILAQIPRLLLAIKKEHEWLEDNIVKHNITRVISDNRYGMFGSSVPSVILTHQLQVQTGLGKMADDRLRSIHYRFLRRFQEVWVPDFDANGLAGKLSHPAVLPGNAKYIGLLSQFADTGQGNNSHLLILLSGPEPQRTILSGLLWKQVASYKGKVVFVEGSTNAADRINVPDNVQYHKLVASAQLLGLINNASYVICRSGYSTIMDLIALKKRGILIPTPGQTEQLYLAKYLLDKKMFFSAQQHTFSLGNAMAAAFNFPYAVDDLKVNNLFAATLDGWLNS